MEPGGELLVGRDAGRAGTVADRLRGAGQFGAVRRHRGAERERDDAIDRVGNAHPVVGAVGVAQRFFERTHGSAWLAGGGLLHALVEIGVMESFRIFRKPVELDALIEQDAGALGIALTGGDVAQVDEDVRARGQRSQLLVDDQCLLEDGSRAVQLVQLQAGRGQVVHHHRAADRIVDRVAVEHALPLVAGADDVALQEIGGAEVGSGTRHETAVPGRFGDLVRPVVELDRAREIALVVGDVAEVVERAGAALLIAQLFPDRERLAVRAFGGLVVADVFGQATGAAVPDPERERRCVAGSRQRLREPAPTFITGVAQRPEPPDRARDPQRQLALATVERPLQRRADVGLLGGEALQPRRLILAVEPDLGPRRQIRHDRRVGSP